MALYARLPKRVRFWLSTLLKVVLTVAGFYLLLTHQIGSWSEDPGSSLWVTPVQDGLVVDLAIDGTALSDAGSIEALRGLDDDAVGFHHDAEADLVYVRLPDGAPSRGHALSSQGAPGLGRLAIADAVSAHIRDVDGTQFVLWALVAMGIKFVGVIASAGAWWVLQRGQGLRYPFWQQVMTAFLIGRFIGTFLPSTLGLDGYTLYESGRYSNQWHRALTAKALEKFLGIVGLLLGVLVTLPAGYYVLSQAIGESAGLVTALIGLVCGGISAVVVGGLVFPQPFKAIYGSVADILPGPIGRHTGRFVEAATAYEGKYGLIFSALALKFVTHFNTAVVYFFTALAIGVVSPEFLPIVFGSLLQIFGTLFSPTIAGEGAREALQALLLSNYYGGPAQAVLAAALGFVAAEAATLWGGAFLWTRTAGWRPNFMEVDGQQVDYAWLSDDDGGFDVVEAQARMKEARSAD